MKPKIKLNIELTLFILLLISIIFALLTVIDFFSITIIIFLLALIVLKKIKDVSNRNKYIMLIFSLLKIGIIFWIINFIVIQFHINTAVSYKQKADDYDYILILGAGLEGEEISIILRNRLELGLILARNMPSAKIIVSGGQGSDELISEAEAMQKYLIGNGIKKNRIIIEDKSSSTAENFKFSKVIYDQISDENDKVIFISNDFHLFRSKKLAERYNFKVDAIACHTPLRIKLNYLAREYLAVIKSLLFD